MPKWTVRTYMAGQEEPIVDNFDDDQQKNSVVEALRGLMRSGEVTSIEIEEPATGGLARIA